MTKLKKPFYHKDPKAQRFVRKPCLSKPDLVFCEVTAFVESSWYLGAFVVKFLSCTVKFFRLRFLVVNFFAVKKFAARNLAANYN
jgi:hypothetical protein